MDVAKVSDETLLAMLAACPRGMYRHYRTGDICTVVGAAIDEATLQPLVLYQHEGGVTFARPLAAWDEMIDATGRRRFTKVEG